MSMPVTTTTRPSPPRTFAHLTGAVRDNLAALDAFLETQVQEFEPEVRDMVAYCLRNQGKRIRPLLVFLWGGGDPGKVSPELVRTSAVIELVHLATLVHDDILDDASLRHNTDTVAEKWGNSMAVLIGDALFSQALKLASEFPTVRVCREVSQATRNVCSGEILQNFQNSRNQPDIAHYYRVIDLKTAELFRVSCLLGAEIGGQAQGIQELAASFGRQLGTAYQIFDDLMDILGSERTTGKTLGTDIATAKFTLPVLLLLRKLPRAEALGLRGRILEGDLQSGEFIKMMEAHGSVREVKDTFDKALRSANEDLEKLPDSHSRGLLATLTDFLEREMDKLVETRT